MASEADERIRTRRSTRAIAAADSNLLTRDRFVFCFLFVCVCCALICAVQFDDDSDRELLNLIPFLRTLKDVKDVRPLIRDTFMIRLTDLEFVASELRRR